MRKLTKIATAAFVATAALGGATAASAHPGDGYGYGADRGYNRGHDRNLNQRAHVLRQQLDQLALRIDRNDRRDRISEREAAGLRREIRNTRDQFRWFYRDGLDQREYRVLEARVDRIRYRLQGERRDWDGRRG